MVTGLVLAYTVLIAWRNKDKQHSAWIVATLMLSFFIVQAVIGGAVVLSKAHLVWRGFHLAMGAATWATSIVLIVLAARTGQTRDGGFYAKPIGPAPTDRLAARPP